MTDELGDIGSASAGMRDVAGRKTKVWGFLNLPTPVSTCAQRQSQVISAEESLFGMTAIRTTAKTIVMTVREKMPMSASFFFSEIRTFQSAMTG